MNAPLQIRDLQNQVDFAIITVRDDEFEAVLERFEPRDPIVGGKQLYEYCTCVTDGGAKYGVAIVRSLEQGQTAAQSVARDVIEDLDPGWLILTGIAGGVPDSDFSLGDVLLASRLHDFSLSAAIPNMNKWAGLYTLTWNVY
jgi:nucleoside phosphorylase